MREPILNLLLVDDEDSVREPLARHLRAEPYKYEVRDVANFEEALQVLDETNGGFDVALIDEVLEDSSSGLDLLRQIKTRYPQIECILFTGWGMQAGLDALRAGAYRYFAKPFNLEELALTIEFAADQNSLQREREYLSALVQVSRELTQATDFEDQLALVWNYVKERLAAPTLFIALYDSESDTLRFHQSYDEGDPDPLPDRHLGTDPSGWGIAGYVLKTGREQIWFNREQARQLWKGLGIKPHVSGKGLSESGICLPLRVGDQTLGALSVQSYKPDRFDPAFLNVVQALANQVAVALENSRLVRETKQKALNLGNLQNLTLAINSTLDLKDVLTQSCKAVVELVGADHSGLVLFDPDSTTGKVFAEYPPTEKMLGQIIPVRGVSAEEQLIFHHDIVNIPDLANDTSLGKVRDILLSFGIRSTLIIPVIFNQKVVASFSLDAMQKPRSYSKDEIEICQRLANQVAVAIENTRLISEEQEATRKMKKQADRLRVLYEIGNELTSAQEVDPILDSIARHLIRLVGARRSLFLLVDNKGKRLIKATGQGYPLEHLHRMTMDEVETGISGWVLGTKEAVLIENVQDDPRNTGNALERARDFGTAPIIVAPLLSNGEAIGTLTVANSVGDPPFEEDDKALVVMLAAQATIAYDNVRRMQELKQLQKGAEALAGALEPTHVLQQIVESACQILQADSSAVWSFDNVRNQTIPEELVAHAIPMVQLERFRKQAPTQGGTAETVMKKRWVGVTDISDPKYSFIGPSTMELLKTIGAKSFEGIALKAGDENLGVLYVNYNRPREFTREDRGMLETFANHASLALKKARLSNQVKTARDTAAAIAQIVALGKDGQDAWDSNVARIKEALSCDAITLYRYNEDNGEFVYPPAMAGVQYPEKATLLPSVPELSIAWKVLRRDDLLIVSNAISDPLTHNRRFTIDEGIKSLAGIPLKVGDRRVGVMFINYRNNYLFTQDELIHIKLFANQIAVAIRNTQLHERTKEQAGTLEGLYEAGKVITSTLALDEALRRISEQALNLVRGQTQDGCFSHVALCDGNKLKFIAASSPKMLRALNRVEIDLETSPKKSIAGRAVLSRSSQNVPDVNSDLDYISTEININSQLSVPLKIDERIIGVLSIEHPARNAFSSEDVMIIELLAAQASIAIENAHRVTQIENMRAAAEDMAHVTTVQEILNQIVASARKIMGADATAIWQYNDLQESFVPDGLVCSGIPEGLDNHFQWQVPQQGGIAYTILERGMVSVEDVSSSNVSYLRDENRNSLIESGVHSFLGITLKVGEEKLGVLYVDYSKPRAFGDEEYKAVKTFANQAAIALKNAGFLEQRNRARKASLVVAELTVLGDLNKTLESIVSGAKEVLRCDVVTLYTYNQETDEFGSPPSMAGVEEETKILMLGRVTKQSVVNKILALENVHKAEDVSSDSLMRGPFLVREKIKSAVGIPLQVGGRKVGVMFVNYRSHHHFTDDESANIELFANQAAVAIRNAQLFHSQQQYTKALEAIQATSAAVSAIRELKVLLPMITNKAAEIFNTTATSLMLWDESKENLVIRAAFGLSDKYQHEQRIARSAVEKIVAVKGLGPHVININQDSIGDPELVKSEELYTVLVAPFAIGSELIGILNIYSKTGPRKFEEKEKELAAIFANHATIVIQNASSYEELKRVKGLVGARTALAWTGMISSTWRHAITRDTVTIRDQIKLLHNDLASVPESSPINNRLEMIERLANRILEKPITAPLGAEEGAISIPLNICIRDRVNSLWKHDFYKPVEVALDFTLKDSATVRASSEWLQRVLDILIDNAINAMRDVTEPRLSISTRRYRNEAEILIQDNGHGIPAEVLEHIFQEPVRKLQGEKGQGMGLLFAQTIIQTYGGEIRVDETRPTRTIIIVALPLEGSTSKMIGQS